MSWDFWRIIEFPWQTCSHPYYLIGIAASPAITDFDVCLLKLEQPIPFRKNIAPACLPRQGEPIPAPGTRCLTTGTRTGQQQNKIKPKQKWNGENQENEMQFQTNWLRKIHKTLMIGNHSTNSRFCLSLSGCSFFTLSTKNNQNTGRKISTTARSITFSQGFRSRRRIWFFAPPCKICKSSFVRIFLGSVGPSATVNGSKRNATLSKIVLVLKYGSDFKNFQSTK